MDTTEALTARKPFISDLSPPGPGCSLPSYDSSQEMASGQSSNPSLPKELPFDFLKKITNDFSSELEIGKGAFGSLYKGILEDGGAIAVKKLGENSKVPPGVKFEKEVQNFMALEHENIVKLVQFCREAQNKLVKSNGKYIVAEITETLLCYEYLPTGSLHDNLVAESSTIDWDTRFNIVKGICQGLHFLHNLRKPIFHLDLNPQNVWLDDNMVPKIANFGFARLFGEEKTRMYTRSDIGSVGYMAPEYLHEGEISAQSDIYSLGLMIIEIVTNEKNCSGPDQKHARKFIDEVKQNWTKDVIMFEYPDLDVDCLGQVKTCIDIGLQCVEIDQKKRPSINKILNMLNGRDLP